MVGTEELSSINCPDCPFFIDGARASRLCFFYHARSQGLLALKTGRGDGGKEAVAGGCRFLI